MIDHSLTRIFETSMLDVETASAIAEEGLALVYVKQGAKTVARLSTGNAGEIYAGVTLNRNIPPTQKPVVTDARVSASQTVELLRAPITGQILVRVDGNVLDIVAGDPADATEVKLDNSTLTFHASLVGKVATVQYRYELSASEARLVIGDMPYGGPASIYEDVIGTLVRGDFATSCYDSSADWSSVIHPRLGADGNFTASGTGTVLTNLIVETAPSAGSPMLVLRAN